MRLSINPSPQLFLIIILSIGIILRFYNINYDDLWYDEIISFWVSNPEHLLTESLKIHKGKCEGKFICSSRIDIPNYIEKKLPRLE